MNRRCFQDWRKWDSEGGEEEKQQRKGEEGWRNLCGEGAGEEQGGEQTGELGEEQLEGEEVYWKMESTEGGG